MRNGNTDTLLSGPCHVIGWPLLQAYESSDGAPNCELNPIFIATSCPNHPYRVPLIETIFDCWNDDKMAEYCGATVHERRCQQEPCHTDETTHRISAA